MITAFCEWRIPCRRFSPQQLRQGKWRQRKAAKGERPARTKSRRVTPSQCRYFPPTIVSMIASASNTNTR